MATKVKHDRPWEMKRGRTDEQVFRKWGAVEVCPIRDGNRTVNVSMVKLADGKWYWGHSDNTSVTLFDDTGFEAVSGRQAFHMHEALLAGNNAMNILAGAFHAAREASDQFVKGGIDRTKAVAEVKAGEFIEHEGFILMVMAPGDGQNVLAVDDDGDITTIAPSTKVRALNMTE